MKMRVIQDEQELTKLLLDKDETALSQLFLFFSEILRNHFLAKYQLFQNDTFELEDIITDSLLELSIKPEKYDPAKSSLKTFVFRDVEGNLINALKRKNAQKNSVYKNVVELGSSHGNIYDEEDNSFVINHENLSSELKTFFASVFSSSSDQILAWMIVVERIRETEKFGTILNIQHKRIEEQEEIVKRNKDRIKAMLKRKGLDELLKKLRSNAY